MSQRQYIHITPSNQPANSVISYKAGIPLVVFTIGEQERYLLGKTIRLNGKFRLRKGIPSASNAVDAVDKHTNHDPGDQKPNISKPTVSISCGMYVWPRLAVCLDHPTNLYFIRVTIHRQF
jgi:hypothetical protein